MPIYEYHCADCEGYFSEHVPMSDHKTPQDCPGCGRSCGRVWLEAPLTRIGGEGSDRMIKSMKRSFKERFVKKELDDVRHKHGNTIDESFVSAAVERIKHGEDNEVAV